MKKYFVTVSSLYNTTKLGRMLADKVFDKYDRTIVSASQLLDIPCAISIVMDDLLFSFPRLKPMIIGVHGFTRGIAKDINLGHMSDIVQIWAYTTANGHNDNRAFTLHATEIRIDRSYQEKGGDK